MARGNPENLIAAAARKRSEATQRAEHGIRQLLRRGERVSFRAVAREARCSPDFLYRSSELRSRIEHLRAQQSAESSRRPVEAKPTGGNVARALASQLVELRQRHRAEVADLQAALAVAHGELLAPAPASWPR